MKKNLMVIFDRYLSQDGVKLRIGGVVTRDVAHYQGAPHGSVQVAIIVPAMVEGKIAPHILLNWRSEWKKTFPETWDIYGGHRPRSDCGQPATRYDERPKYVYQSLL